MEAVCRSSLVCSFCLLCLQIKVIKEHILEFSGIPEQDDKARESLFGKIAKWKRTFVQEIMDVLGVRLVYWGLGAATSLCNY